MLSMLVLQHQTHCPHASRKEQTCSSCWQSLSSFMPRPTLGVYVQYCVRSGHGVLLTSKGAKHGVCWQNVGTRKGGWRGLTKGMGWVSVPTLPTHLYPGSLMHPGWCSQHYIFVFVLLALPHHPHPNRYRGFIEAVDTAPPPVDVAAFEEVRHALSGACLLMWC